VVASALTSNDNPVGSGGVAGGSIVTTTVSCPGGSTLLNGGSNITSSQSGNVGGPGNGGQGVHVIANSPSDTTGAPVASGDAGSWTVIGQNGGQNIDTPDVQAFALRETQVVMATPTLTTQASAGVSLGGSVSDTAMLAAGVNPTGTITFNLYGPSATPDCSGTPVTTSTATVSGNGSYPSATFSPTAAGTYYWTASYGGDANNAAASSNCTDATESVTVTGSGSGGGSTTCSRS
jgi:hypothetical protein